MKQLITFDQELDDQQLREKAIEARESYDKLVALETEHDEVKSNWKSWIGAAKGELSRLNKELYNRSVQIECEAFVVDYPEEKTRVYFAVNSNGNRTKKILKKTPLSEGDQIGLSDGGEPEPSESVEKQLADLPM